MAFATANVKANYFGSLNVTTGDWSGAVGDAPGTITVKGGRIYLCNFSDQDGTAPQQIDVLTSTAQSNATTTITVYNNQTTTTGRFLIISA